MIGGCQLTNHILDSSDSYVAESVGKLSEKDICIALKKNYGPKTISALKTESRSRNLNCDAIKGINAIVETSEQRNRRINEAIQLFNSAAQLSSPTYNQYSPSGMGGICHLSGQSKSGLYKNCAYNCVSGTVYRTMNSTDICPISVNQ